MTSAYEMLEQHVAKPGYTEPTFNELLKLCLDFGLLSEFHVTPYGMRLKSINQAFDVSVKEAEILMKGLLLGFFYGHSRDDLRLAQWEE